MKLSILALLFSFSLAQFPPKFRNCGKETDDMTLTGLILSPNPPLIGSNLNTSAIGFMKKPVLEGASTQVLAKLGILTVYNQKFDNCKLFNGCPGVGYLVQNLLYPIPKGSPAGVNVLLTVVTTQPNGDPISCFTGTIVLTNPDTLDGANSVAASRRRTF